MVPVSGLLAPTDMRPEMGAAVPPRRPGANTTLFSRPRGTHCGGTSWATIAEVIPRPPRVNNASGTGCSDTSRVLMFTRTIRSATSTSFLCAASDHELARSLDRVCVNPAVGTPTTAERTLSEPVGSSRPVRNSSGFCPVLHGFPARASYQLVLFF